MKDKLPPGMMVRPVHVRIYPNGKIAGAQANCRSHGKNGPEIRMALSITTKQMPGCRDARGLEQTFNDMLTGKNGEYKMPFHKDGRKTWRNSLPRRSRMTLATTLDWTCKT